MLRTDVRRDDNPMLVFQTVERKEADWIVRSFDVKNF
jgi:hypothetical protein